MKIYPELVGVDFENRLIENMTSGDYRADRTAVSSSGIRAAVKSLRHFEAGFILGDEQPVTDAMKFGTAAHLAILEPAKFDKVYFQEPEFLGITKDGRPSSQSAEAREKKKEWYARLPDDAVVLSEEKLGDLKRMIDNVLSHNDAVTLLKDSVYETSGFFRDPATSLKCRIRPDCLRNDLRVIVDLKTSATVERGAFAKIIWAMSYHVQMAFYCYGIKLIKNKTPDRAFVAVQNVSPFDVMVYEPDQAMISRGDDAVQYGLIKIKHGIDNNYWPGQQPDGRAEVIALPAWTDSINNPEAT